MGAGASGTNSIDKRRVSGIAAAAQTESEFISPAMVASSSGAVPQSDAPQFNEAGPASAPQPEQVLGDPCEALPDAEHTALITCPFDGAQRLVNLITAEQVYLDGVGWDLEDHDCRSWVVLDLGKWCPQVANGW